MKPISSVVVFGFTCCQVALCQLPQLHSELCGTPGGVVDLPPGISAIAAPGEYVRLSFSSGRASIRLEETLGVDEVCPLRDGRLVVFGHRQIAKIISIVDPAKSAVLDSFWGYDPILAPDQRWVVFQKFYPRTSDYPPSDEYLGYDLSKTPRENRGSGVDIGDALDAGKVLYPRGWKNEPASNMGARDELQHWHLSSFFWAPDGKALVFADKNQEKKSIVLITFADNGETSAVVRPLDDYLLCEDPAREDQGEKARATGFRHVEFGPRQGLDRLIFIDPDAEGCTPQRLILHSDTFQSATTEVLPDNKIPGKSIIKK